MDPVAQAGFGSSAEAYERGRPGYPDEVLDHLASVLPITSGSTVVDLGAGTGKLTRLLTPRAGRTIAVEPVDGMLDQLRSAVPTCEVLAGAAEAIPLPDESVDAVTVAQAFHWFRYRDALAEIARILVPGGGLALVWNVRDGQVPWVAQLSELIHWHRHDVSAYESRTDWAAVIADAGRFTQLRRVQMTHVQIHDRQTLLDRVASVSYIAAMDPGERQKVLDDVDALIAEFPPEFPMPYRTDVYWCHRKG